MGLKTKELLNSKLKITINTIKSSKWFLKNKSLLFLAISLLAWFLLFESFIRINNLYMSFPDIDIPSHLFSGLALGMIFLWFSLSKYKLRNLWIPIISTFIAAILWEILESIDDILFFQPEYLKDYLIWDGIFDIIFTTGGALLASWAIKYIQPNPFYKKYVKLKNH